MTEFTIQVDDKIVRDFGKDVLERYFQEFYSQALLKLAAKDILKDWDDEEVNDKQWQAARERAWQKQGNYFLTMN